MCRKVVALVACRDEGTHLDILVGNLLLTHLLGNKGIQLLLGKLLTRIDFPYLPLVKILLHSLNHTIECHLGCVRDEREYGVVKVVVDSLENLLLQVRTEFLALGVDITVVSAAEIDSLE